MRARKGRVARELEALESRPRATSAAGHLVAVGALLADPDAPVEALALDEQDREAIQNKTRELRAVTAALKQKEVEFLTIRAEAAGRLLNAHVRAWKRQQAMKILVAADALARLFDEDAAVSGALYDQDLPNSWSLIARIAGSADVAALRQRLQDAGLLAEEA